MKYQLTQKLFGNFLFSALFLFFKSRSTSYETQIELRKKVKFEETTKNMNNWKTTKNISRKINKTIFITCAFFMMETLLSIDVMRIGINYKLHKASGDAGAHSQLKARMNSTHIPAKASLTEHCACIFQHRSTRKVKQCGKLCYCDGLFWIKLVHVLQVNKSHGIEFAK